MVNSAELLLEQSTPTKLAKASDHELVRLTRMGDISAFEELVSRTTDICLRVATCILKSREDARDEVQNAFWLAYSKIELFTYQSKFSTWLARIVINRCFRRLRTSQRKPVFSNQVPTTDGGWYSCEAVACGTPEIDFARQEVKRVLRRELSNVPSLLRIPIEMHYIHELPIKEVAMRLGLTTAAVKSRLHRGHLFLRDRMLKHAAQCGPAGLTTNFLQTPSRQSYI
jgi:RNA polymerase sigma-70 factor (ECF subfamily)